MNRLIELYSYNRNDKGLAEISEVLSNNGIVAIPTDSGYALICKMSSKKATEKIKKIRLLDDKHNFTLMCRDLSEISYYAKVDNLAYRALKKHTPGPYTFILSATKKVSSLLVTPNKKTIGIRVSEHYVPNAIIEEINEPIIVSSFILPGSDLVVTDCADVDMDIMNKIDAVVESDYCGFESTSVIQMTETPYEILREGSGDVSLF